MESKSDGASSFEYKIGQQQPPLTHSVFSGTTDGPRIQVRE